MFFKNKNLPITAIHPEIKKLVKYAFTINDGSRDIDFYEFETLFDMPAKRYEYFNDFIEDYERGINNKELTHNLDEAIKDLESGDNTKGINAIIRLKWMKTRSEIRNDVDLILRLISCAFFTNDEDLLTYDWDVSEWKIKLFEKQGVPAFFLTAPIKRYWRSTNISEKDIQIISKQRLKKRKAYEKLKKMGIYTVWDSLESKKGTNFT